MTPNQESTHVVVVLSLEEAKAILQGCVRGCLKDSWSGSSELDWFKDGKEYATGFLSYPTVSLVVYPQGMYVGCEIPIACAKFSGDEARELMQYGVMGSFQFN